MIKNELVLERLKHYNFAIDIETSLLKSHIQHNSCKPPQNHTGRHPSDYQIYHKCGNGILKHYCILVSLKNTFLEGYQLGLLECQSKRNPK